MSHHVDGSLRMVSVLATFPRDRKRQSRRGRVERGNGGRGEAKPLADAGEEPGGHYPMYEAHNRPSPLPFILAAACRNRNSYFRGPSEPSEFIITRNTQDGVRARRTGVRAAWCV